MLVELLLAASSGSTMTAVCCGCMMPLPFSSLQQPRQLNAALTKSHCCGAIYCLGAFDLARCCILSLAKETAR